MYITSYNVKIKQRQTFLRFYYMSNQGFYFIDKSVIIEIPIDLDYLSIPIHLFHLILCQNKTDSMSFFFKQIFKNARDKVLKGSVADRPVPLVPKRSTGKTTYLREEKLQIL